MPGERPKFVLIEQSLLELGGHYFEYARDILTAAEAAGYEPVLATHQKFAAAAELPRAWTVRPLFPYVSDRIHRIPSAASLHLWQQLTTGRQDVATSVRRLADALTDRCKAAISELRWWRRLTRVRGFAQACARLFSEVGLREGDHVLCSTMSDMDLLGLVRFLSSEPATRYATWHLQFHFSVYQGRDPDYPAQDRQVAGLQRRLAAALASVPMHRLHGYTTTDELGRQFNRLGVKPFQTLAWPVGKQFQRLDKPSVRQPPSAAPLHALPLRAHPLRALCAGGVRREKGSDQLGGLVQSLWTDWLAPGRLQLLVQVPPKRRAQAMLELPPGSLTAATRIDPLPASPLVSLPHPLLSDDYAALIREADVGLLLYHSDVYFARCSGILCELLAAGVPVVVPAGCWLAEQIAEENFRHLDRIAAGGPLLRKLTDCELQWKQHDARTTAVSVPAGCRDLLVRCWRAASEPAGSYLRLQATQFDSAGQPLSSQFTILGTRKPPAAKDAPVSALFPISPDCTRVELSLSSAYRLAPVAIERTSLTFLASPAGEATHRPAGALGLCFGELRQVPALLRDISANLDHYRAAASAFARVWQAEHAAERTIETLTGQVRAAVRAA